MTSSLVPDVTHPDFAAFWRGCAEHRLVMPRCRNDHVIWPPRPACARCGELVGEWSEVHGSGRLYSWTVVHRTNLPWYSERTPYVVGVVTLDHLQRVRMVGRCAVDPADLVEGLELVVDYEVVAGELTVPLWRAAVRGEARRAG
jgi:uncharacterized protein